MRRAFWASLGLGAGATGAILASRWARKQARRVAPASLGREARSGLLELSKLVSESLAEGRNAMRDRERELRGSGDGSGNESGSESGNEHTPAA